MCICRGSTITTIQLLLSYIDGVENGAWSAVGVEGPALSRSSLQSVR